MSATQLLTAISFLFVAASAQADQSLSCDYLENAQGVFAPGLSRPLVSVGPDRADVTVYLQGGGGLNQEEHFVLGLSSASSSKRTYVDSSGEARLNVAMRGSSAESASLLLRGLRTQCR